ncbi:MAG: DUF2231 domain-containing protein [Gemmatimonadaceae bacterium]
MPNIAAWHPQIVHFVVALLIVGVGARIISLTGKFKFTSPAATTLIVMGAVAAWLAVRSGVEAHGPVERIPGTRDLVIEHEELGIKTRNIFFAVAALELLALGLGRKEKLARYAKLTHVATALIGVWGAFELYHTAEHGGKLVYSYAGGPGLRTGNSKDVERLLMAGLYNQSRVDRREGRRAESAALVNEMAKRFAQDTMVRFLHAESLLLDARDYAAALTALNRITVAPTDARWGVRLATLKADIYLAMNRPDSARATLASAVAAFPTNARLKAKLDSLPPLPR